MGFSRQEYWSGLPFPSLGDLPDPLIEPRSPTLQADWEGTQFLVSVSCSIPLNSLQLHGLQLDRIFYPWDSPGKNMGVSCHSLLQGIFPTRGSNPGLPHCRQTLYPLSHQGSPTGFMVGLLVRPPRGLTPRLTSQDCCCQCPHPRSRLLLTHTSTGDPQTLTDRSGSISCGVTAPFP